MSDVLSVWKRKLFDWAVFVIFVSALIKLLYHELFH